MNTETPRTDGMLAQHFLGRKYVLADEVVKLERELGEEMRKHGTAEKAWQQDRDQLIAEAERLKAANFRQATKIQDIAYAGNAFYNELAQALGLDHGNDLNPPIVGEVKKLKSQVQEIRAVACGEKEVANDDTEALQWIVAYIDEANDALCEAADKKR